MYCDVLIVHYFERKVKKMKRILSTILAIVMVLSVCSCLTFTVSAIEDYERYQIKTNGFKDGQITFDIQLAPNQTIYDAMVSVKYNTSVLEVVKAGPAVTVDEDGNETEVVGGLHEHGVPIDNNQYYTFAYTNSNQDGYKIGSNAKIFSQSHLK